MGIRTKSKENIFGMNPARAKISNRPIDGHKYRMSTHIDYYGMISERWFYFVIFADYFWEFII